MGVHAGLAPVTMMTLVLIRVVRVSET
jgi:hypothetical protein